MIIGLDLDEVLADFINNFLAYYNNINKTSFKQEEIYDYNIFKVWKQPKEKIMKSIYDFYKTPYFENIKPISGAVEGVEILSQKHELKIITSRQNDIKQKTIKWIEKYFPNKFSQTYFTNHFSFNGSSSKKSEICLSENVDIMIEDSPEHAIDCASVSTKVMLLNRPWNKSNKFSKNILRVQSWKEIIKNIK